MIRSSFIRINLIIILLVLFSPNLVSAETKTFIKEYTYHAGDEDSKNSCRVIALREVKRLLLEELGTYLESETEVKNFQMTKDQIVTLTAGIVKTELIEEKWNTENLKYWLKVKISANPQDVTKAIDSLRKDRAKVKELEELRKRSEELLRENERLAKELKTAKDDARKEAAQAYKQNIDNLSATEWLEKGCVLGISGNNAEAAKAFSKAIELNPEYARAYYNRGVTYGKLGNTEQELKDYNTAIEINQLYENAYNNRGAVYSDIGNYQQAIKDYNKVIELDPQDVGVYADRGYAYYKLGDYQQAIKDYNKAIELHPSYANVYNKRGLAYLKLGNTQQALKDFNKAIELNPQNPHAYYNKAISYAKLGNKNLSFENLKIAARLDHKEAQNLLRSNGFEWTNINIPGTNKKKGCLSTITASIYNQILEDLCKFNGGVSKMLLAMSYEAGCFNMISNEEYEYLYKEVFEDTKQRYKDSGKKSFCKGNKKAYYDLATQAGEKTEN